MTHDLLPRVVDVANPNGSTNDVGRMRWRQALLLEFCILYLSLYIHMCVKCICYGASWYLVGCNRHNVYVIVRFHVVCGFSLVEASFRIG